MTPPTNVSEVRSFLGMMNQLGKFIPHLAKKDKPLRDLLSKQNHWVWEPDQPKAFQILKEWLSSTPVLALYNPNKDIKVSADTWGAVTAHRSGPTNGNLWHMHHTLSPPWSSDLLRYCRIKSSRPDVGM